MVTATAAGCGLVRSDETATGTVDPSEPAVDADSDLVATVGQQLATALALAVATGSSVPQLRSLTRRLASLHRSHLDQLGQPDDVDAGRVTGIAATARARLLRAEETLQRQLVRAALDAESGALAQVLASMAAAVAQQRAVAL